MRNRWFIALAAIGLHISIGSGNQYAWRYSHVLLWQIWGLLYLAKQHGHSH